MNEQVREKEAGPAIEPEQNITFNDFKLLPEIQEAISGMGFKTPTPVQARTFKTAVSGRDFIAMAQTGTGKTAAFGIPIAQRIEPKSGVQALILAPTRELALQVSKEIGRIGAGRSIQCAAIYGGASFTAQVTEIKSGAQVVAGTPGRVLDHIRRKTISFSGLKMLVLDEADEMLSMGFEKELSEIMESLPRKKQTMLFSATIPDDIQRLSKRYMGEAEIISVSDDGIGARDVSHYMYLVTGQKRSDALVKVLEAERPDSAIVFCNTREETQLVAAHLKRHGYNADWLNSDLSQSERERVMKATRSGKIKFLVATDVAARGIDVSHLSHVINYTFPESLEVYVHRTGRTGRAGRQGAAVSLIAPQDIGLLYMLRLTYKIFPVEKTLVSEVEAARVAELGRLDALRKAFSNGAGAGFEGLAKRLMCDVRGERIISGLLRRYFDEVGETADMAAAFRGRSAEPPTAQVGPPVDMTAEADVAPQKSANDGARSPFSDMPFDDAEPEDDGADAADENVVASTPKTGPEDEDLGEKGEIYLNAGRKDGLRISSLMKVVMQRTGLPRTALGKVRMLTRSTFVSVPPEYFDQVLKALAAVEVDGISMQAEPAQES